MSPTRRLLREAVNDEIARIGFYNDTERQHYVATGRLADGRDVDMISEVFEAVEKRTGVPVKRLREMFRPLNYRRLGYGAVVLWSTHRERVPA